MLNSRLQPYTQQIELMFTTIQDRLNSRLHQYTQQFEFTFSAIYTTDLTHVYIIHDRFNSYSQQTEHTFTD